MERAFFPWDEALSLGEYSWTPQVVQDVLRLGVLIPSYRDAAETFTELTGLGVSKSSLQRLVGLEGKKQVAREETEAKAISAVPKVEEEVVWRKIPEPDSPIMSVSSDGVMVNVRDEGWKEVKIVAISALEKGNVTSEGEAAAPKLSKHSYRAGLWDAKTFTNHHWAEACRRGLEKAEKVLCISDGAVWIWMMVFMCFPKRIEILDFWHALEYLGEVANALFAEDDAAAKTWFSKQKQALLTQGVRPVLQSIRQAMPRHQPLPEAVRIAVGYFSRNRHRMHYPHYRAQGLPIGSGAVESACKTVVQARMKQAGMRWSREGAQAMLSLRCLLLSGRWHELASP